MNNQSSTLTPEAEIIWKENDDLVQEVLSYFDVANLTQKKATCQQWEQLCVRTIDDKARTSTTRQFKTSEELCEAV